MLAGYALAMLHFRGRGTVFFTLLLVLVVPFQLLMIPLYVLIARDYGLGDSYIGMILPFAINSTAVFIFRQYFMQLPPELFQAARIDGAGELRSSGRIALPLVRAGPADRGAADLHRPVERVPLAVPGHQGAVQTAAGGVAGELHHAPSTASTANPFGAILAGACVLAMPAVGLFLIFQRHFVSTDLGSGVKG